MSRQEASEPPGQHARAGRLTAGRSRLAETHRETGQEEAGTGTPTAAGASPVMAQPLVSEGLEVTCIRQPPGRCTSTATPGIRVTSHKRRGVSFPPLPALPSPHKSKFEGKLPRSWSQWLVSVAAGTPGSWGCVFIRSSRLHSSPDSSQGEREAARRTQTPQRDRRLIIQGTLGKRPSRARLRRARQAGRQGASGYRRAGPMGSSLPSGPEKRGAHAGAGPTRPKLARLSKKPRLKGSEVRDRAPLCAGHLHPGDPVLQAWGRSLSPHDRFSDLSYVPATPAPLILQKRGKNGPRQASSGQKPDAFGVPFSKNRCWAESLIGVMDGVQAPRTSPCDSAARATGHSVLR